MSQGAVNMQGEPGQAALRGPEGLGVQAGLGQVFLSHPLLWEVHCGQRQRVGPDNRE